MSAKRTVVFLLIGMIGMMVGCSSKYSDVVEVNTKFVEAMEDYITATEKADSAQDIAHAINEYADRLEKLAPKIKAVRGKYPELTNTTEVPEELKSIQRKAQGLEQKVANSYMNMMRYMMDPKVQAAQKRLQEAMMSMQ